MQFGAYPADDADAFAEIDLRMSRVGERHEHLARPRTHQPDIVFYDRIATGKAVFDPQLFKIRFAVCLCFGGAALSASRIASITGTSGPSFGRSGALDRT
jgi:hypothetical protein